MSRALRLGGLITPSNPENLILGQAGKVENEVVPGARARAGRLSCQPSICSTSVLPCAVLLLCLRGKGKSRIKKLFNPDDFPEGEVFCAPF